MGDLTLAVLRKSLKGNLPCLIGGPACDHTQADTRWNDLIPLISLLAGRFRVLDRRRSDLPRGGDTRLGRARDEDARKQGLRKLWLHLQVRDLVVLALEANRPRLAE